MCRCVADRGSRCAKPCEGKGFSLPRVTTAHAAGKAATQRRAVNQQNSFQTVWYRSAHTLHNNPSESQEPMCFNFLFILFILHAFFSLIVLSFAVSASLLSRGGAMEATPSNVGFFFFLYPTCEHCVYLGQALIYASPFCVTTHNHRSTEM